MAEKSREEDSQKAQSYLELYHLLVRGMEVIGAFMQSAEDARKSSAGKQLERAYVLLRRDYLEMCNEYSEISNTGYNIFNAIPRLGGSYTAEYIANWAEGNVEVDELGEPHRYGGYDGYQDQLADISERAYLAGIEDIEVEPKEMQCKKSYDLAYDAIKNIKAMSIDEYSLTWDEENNEIILNNTYKIKNIYPGADSNTSKLLAKIEEARAAAAKVGKKDGNDVEFDFEPSGARTTAQVIMDLGMTPILRKIFFPKGTRGNHIHFRSPVSKKTLKIEGVDFSELFKEVDLKIVEAEIKNSREDIIL